MFVRHLQLRFVSLSFSCCFSFCDLMDFWHFANGASLFPFTPLANRMFLMWLRDSFHIQWIYLRLATCGIDLALTAEPFSSFSLEQTRLTVFCLAPRRLYGSSTFRFHLNGEAVFTDEIKVKTRDFSREKRTASILSDEKRFCRAVEREPSTKNGKKEKSIANWKRTNSSPFGLITLENECARNKWWTSITVSASGDKRKARMKALKHTSSVSFSLLCRAWNLASGGAWINFSSNTLEFAATQLKCFLATV